MNMPCGPLVSLLTPVCKCNGVLYLKEYFENVFAHK